jgi:autotransporter-associated beta strand protein
LFTSSYEFVFMTTNTTATEMLTGSANTGNTVAAQVWLNENDDGTQLTADSIRLFIRDNSFNVIQAAFVNATAFDGNYHHLVWTYNAGIVNAYLDGVPQALTISILNSTPNNFSAYTFPIAFACYDSRGTYENFTAATMDEAATYTNALSPAQVTTHYDALNGIETWVGNAAADFATAANWTPAALASGDSLIFGTAGTQGTALNNNETSFTFSGIAFGATATAYTIGGNSFTLAGSIANNSPTAQQIINAPIALAATENISDAGGGTLLGGAISGTGFGIIENISGNANNSGTVTLTNNSTYTGGTTINAGTLILDYTGGAASNIVPSGSALTLGGGAIQIKGNSTTSSSQTVNGATVNPGFNVISVGNNSPTLALGAFTQTLGSQMEFIGPAYDSNPSGGSATLVPATGTITTTTLGKQNNLLWPSTRQAIATVGLYNWASVVTSGTGAQSILSGDQVSGFYTTVANNGTAAKADLNYDLLGNATFDNSTPAYVDTIRFNVPGAFTATTGAGGTGYILLIGGILVTPNVGAYNTTIANGNEWIAGNYAGNCPIDVYQNNTAGELFINAPIYYYNTNSRATCFVKGGAGTVVLTGSGTSSANTGSPYLNGGCTVINNNTQIGATGTAAPLYLNGGTLVASGNTSLDNGSGANERPVTLLGNGGGLAAYSGTTLTVGGQIGSAANTGTLVIGIPASSANGSVAGQLPGTGTGTANSQVLATGTVVLTGANTYTGNTAISKGTLKLGAAGSINYSPNIIVGAGATYDVSLVTGGYTLAAGANLMGSGTVNGAVVVAPGSGIYGGTDGTYGTNTFASNLNLASGAAAYFDLGTSANGSNDLIVVSGTLTLNGNTIHLKAPSPTAVLAPANYLLFSDASLVASNAALTLVWDVPPANSAKYALAVSGNNVILQYVTLTPLVQLIATNYNPANGKWTDSSGNGNNATYTKFSGTLTLPVLASGVTPNGSSAVDIIATNGSFNFSSSLSGASGYTVFAYVMPTTDTGGSRFALTGGSAGYALEYNFYQGHQNWVSEYQGGGGPGTATIPTSSFSLVDLAISASGGTFTGGSFRLNGASDGTTGAGAGSTTSPITRVGNNEGGGDGFVGDIAEIDIYNGVLSSNQISTVEAQLTTNYYLNVSATALASSQNPSPTTSNITFTATVSAASGGGTPNTGTVTFYEGTVTLGTGTVNGSGVATFTTAALTHAPHTITAAYGGGSSFGGSISSSLSQAIDTPPAAGLQYLTTVMNTALNVSSKTLAGLNYDADGDPLTITAVSTTSINGGTVSNNAGTITYSPATSYVGVDQFTYAISDGFTGGTNLCTANVTVTLGKASSAFNYISGTSGGTVNLRGYGIPTHLYDVQRSGTLNFSSYTNLTPSGIAAAANGVILYIDTSAPNPSYYRFAVH